MERGRLIGHQALPAGRGLSLSAHGGTPMMRLNLPRYSCVHFVLSSEFVVPEAKGLEVKSFIDESETHTHYFDEEQASTAVFASRARVGGIFHRIEGELSRLVKADGTNSIHLWIVSDRASDRLPRPPADRKPISNLISSSSKLFESIDFRCHAIFSYQEADGYESRVDLPIPLAIQDELSGITHIESPQFSRRVDDIIEYRIRITKETNSLVHFVNFDYAAPLTQKSIARLFARAHRISSKFVTQNKGDIYGDDQLAHST